MICLTIIWSSLIADGFVTSSDEIHEMLKLTHILIDILTFLRLSPNTSVIGTEL